mmetsp:Transcript_12916/g.19351  ORF Transcript_12916/g.19351 Transcript_12916/m.19351 type:complete len:106 (-) Transcript_12916:138-455(-)
MTTTAPKNTTQIYAEDMSDEKVEFALSTAQEGFNQASFKGKVFSYIANFIRAQFEKHYGKGWNVVVGRSFGAYVTHEIKTFCYISVVPGVCVLIWRCEGAPEDLA